ncbi:MAG: hypothetical protein M3Y84_00835 [Acidobacteriota bacterium]|nr:hypothetical protein [Acidobacteriota bacterium]
MNYNNLIREIVGAYQKHGWQLRRVLLRPQTRTELGADVLLLNGAQVEESLIDAIWFSRPSHQQREAWELRLLGENPFALLETFEKDETEEKREELRREVEARLRDYISR